MVYPHFVDQLIEAIGDALSSFGRGADMVAARKQSVFLNLLDIVCVLLDEGLIG